LYNEYLEVTFLCTILLTNRRNLIRFKFGMCSQANKIGRPSLTVDQVVERRTAAQLKRAVNDIMKERASRLNGVVLVSLFDSGELQSDWMGTCSEIDPSQKDLVVSQLSAAAREVHARRAKALAEEAAVSAGMAAAAAEINKKIAAGQQLTAEELAESLRAIVASAIQEAAAKPSPSHATTTRPTAPPARTARIVEPAKRRKIRTYNQAWDRFKGHYHRLDK
jgi:hypothetical protein